MAAPNLSSISTIIGQTAVQIVTTTPTAIVSNPASSNQVWKINTIFVGNANTTTNPTVTADFFRSSANTNFASTITVPVGSSLDIISKYIYLQEGDAIRLTASTNNCLQAICSYEIMQT